jgi:hypothetical protein
MKSLFVWPLAGAGLLLATGLANGQDRNADTQSHSRVIFEQNANQSAQDATDMSYGDTGQAGTSASRSLTHASYGGTADSDSAWGGSRCTAGPQCNLFRGR